ncbi:MAG: DUF885 domain-containing protein [Burkholderiales bacterium]|nr:DUF885 domain-containing protein [Burkholderiales bacterium]
MNRNPQQQLAELAERYWQFECEETPLTAALANVPLPDAVLFRESATDWARRDRRAGELQHALEAIDEGALAGQERATHRLLRRELDAVRSHYAVQAHLRPWLFPLGPDFLAVYWANSTAIADADDAARYLERLRTLPAFWRDVEANLVAGAAAGLGWPRPVLACALAGARAGLAGEPGKSPFLGPFIRSAAKAQSALAAAALRAEEIVVTELRPAQRAYVEALERLHAGARDSLSCSETAGGRDYYRAMVRHFTTTAVEPGEVHALGLAEVERIGRAIEAVAAQAGHAGDVAGYQRFLSSDPQFVSPSAEALRETMESLCKRIDRQIPKFFGRIPRITYGLESIPAAASAAMPPAYAQPNPADGSAAGVFWVSGLPAKCPSYLHVPIAVHEAWPGHLMHIALIQEATGLPTFRRHGAVKYTACVEGWALYCESLAEEMGLYVTPHQRYGRLEMELWRAVRLVVDTGIHWHGWSREQAIATMSGCLTLAPETIAGEVDRYAGMPAQALGYQIGNLSLRTLRGRAEATLGARFRHRDFHDAVTGAGAVTLPVLEGLVDEWIAGRTAEAPPAT